MEDDTHSLLSSTTLYNVDKFLSHSLSTKLKIHDFFSPLCFSSYIFFVTLLRLPFMIHLLSHFLPHYLHVLFSLCTFYYFLLILFNKTKDKLPSKLNLLWANLSFSYLSALTHTRVFSVFTPLTCPLRSFLPSLPGLPHSEFALVSSFDSRCHNVPWVCWCIAGLCKVTKFTTARSQSFIP